MFLDIINSESMARDIQKTYQHEAEVARLIKEARKNRVVNRPVQGLLSNIGALFTGRRANATYKVAPQR